MDYQAMQKSPAEQAYGRMSQSVPGYPQDAPPQPMSPMSAVCAEQQAVINELSGLVARLDERLRCVRSPRPTTASGNGQAGAPAPTTVVASLQLHNMAIRHLCEQTSRILEELDV